MLKIYQYLYQTTENEFIPTTTLTDDTIIYLNGLSEYTDYSIDDTTGHILTTDLLITDYLVVVTNSISPIAVGDYGNVPFKRYNNANTQLKYNQIYDSIIELPLDNKPLELKLNFTSRYNPFYCSTKLVIEDIGSFVTLDPETINFIIYDNSLKVLIQKDGSGKLNYDLPIPYELQNPLKIPFNIQQYVRYMTDLDILNAAFLQMSGQSGRINKRLGDMQIEKEVRLPALKDLIAAIKTKLDQYPLGDTAIAKAVLKGSGLDPWPVTSPRRSF